MMSYRFATLGLFVGVACVLFIDLEIFWILLGLAVTYSPTT